MILTLMSLFIETIFEILRHVLNLYKSCQPLTINSEYNFVKWITLILMFGSFILFTLKRFKAYHVLINLVNTFEIYLFVFICI